MRQVVVLINTPRRPLRFPRIHLTDAEDRSRFALQSERIIEHQRRVSDESVRFESGDQEMLLQWVLTDESPDGGTVLSRPVIPADLRSFTSRISEQDAHCVVR